ncbi:MAG: glutathione S-transferase, partial [Nannocystaceae bacterium]
MTVPRLITIAFSHFCDKARWALEHAGVPYTEDVHMPMLHWWATLRAGAGRTVPALVTADGVIADSSEIVAWAHARAQPGRGLYPEDPAARSEAEALEDRFDEKLGPATRRWAYGQLLGDRAVVRALVVHDAPAWERRLAPAYVPVFASLVRRGLNINPPAVRRSFDRIEEIFAEVGDRLRDGRRFLVGDRLSVADLTFATLAAPAVM